MTNSSARTSGIVAALFFSLVLGTATAQESTTKAHNIQIKGFQFVPDKLEINAGDTVIWKNDDIVPHTATGSKAFDSKGLDPGKTWKFIAKKKGVFPYICTFHPTMRAELTVR